MAPEDDLNHLRRELNASLDVQHRHINEVEALRKQLEREYAQTNRRFGQLDSRLGYVDRRFVQQDRAIDQLRQQLSDEAQRRSELGYELRQRRFDSGLFWHVVVFILVALVVLAMVLNAQNQQAFAL